MVAAKGGKLALVVISVVVLLVALSVTGYLFASGSDGWAAALGLSASAFIFLGFPVLSAVLGAVVARRTGAPGGPWLWGAINFFFPLVGLVVLLVLISAQRRHDATQAALQTLAAEKTPTKKECGYCGAVIPWEAVTCPNCAAPQ